ncbi:glycoside hydrolase family 88 protein [Photobacterium sp. ZSDE20]|uniref:Glycoside hydrolase family 88 protein n=1 Tax=Photobacterium pectinilyticum TaxID=2906793 RepID=A0ABT1N7T3_9GAMM|nr:glycoside hydrolase family 88 protein [Photobacterium sp. ZSDE20]MCQ1059894.1 glycoside hydrolase family 88 protein [Photobacterium sp. ZSDE20]MDD1826083.1 glycoside hydrolase family 88 protein [Photobacterium sp. ZSDE20]
MQKDFSWVNCAWSDIVNKVKITSDEMTVKFPSMTTDGVYCDTHAPWAWVVGFWPGLLWLLYEKEKHEPFKKIAIDRENLMDQPLDEYVNIHHDVGFMWQLTSIKHYELFGNEESKTRALKAASHLASRFNISGNFITAWNKNDVNSADPRGLSIIDSMMNLPILFWAAEQLNAPRFALIAKAHADTVLKEFIRSDGSVRHMVEFDYLNGNIKSYHSGQGYDEDSAWSRGASWAIHGFALAYKYTKEAKYLQAALKTAHFFLSCLPEDRVPYWDFRAPLDETTPRDTSAAACAASGMLLISELVEDQKTSIKCLNSAVNILHNIHQRYTTFDQPEEQGILLGGTFNVPKGLGVNCSLIYGDYYYVEAIAKLVEKVNSNTR